VPPVMLPKLAVPMEREWRADGGRQAERAFVKLDRRGARRYLTFISRATCGIVGPAWDFGHRPPLPSVAQ